MCIYNLGPTPPTLEHWILKNKFRSQVPDRQNGDDNFPTEFRQAPIYKFTILPSCHPWKQGPNASLKNSKCWGKRWSKPAVISENSKTSTLKSNGNIGLCFSGLVNGIIQLHWGNCQTVYALFLGNCRITMDPTQVILKSWVFELSHLNGTFNNSLVILTQQPIKKVGFLERRRA